MTSLPILIVDDEADIRELIEITLNRMGHDTHCAANIAEAEQQLASHQYALCLTDMRMPDGNGLNLIDHIQANYPELPVAMITAHGNMDAAIRAMKSGAFDFVSKPIDLKQLREMVTNALKLDKPTTPTAKAASRPSNGKNLLLGSSPAMLQLKTTIGKVSRSQAPVYICGESGTGKELVANSIHQQSVRTGAPFIAVNCSAIPSELLESEFFGHTKGSFTGATTDKPGLFKAAQGGTLFLDEVADLPVAMQVKLLRAIQEKNIRPVGASVEEKVDVRILSASHKDLATLVAQGEFRQDLYYRINVIRIDVPRLHQRQEDIAEIALSVLNKLAQRDNTPLLSLSASAEQALLNYEFPGNVRELENILERASALCDEDKIKAEDLHLPQTTSKKTVSAVENPANEPEASLETLKSNLKESEREQIEQALEKTRWNKTEAAKLLGLTFRQLRYRIKKLDID